MFARIRCTLNAKERAPRPPQFAVSCGFLLFVLKSSMKMKSAASLKLSRPQERKRDIISRLGKFAFPANNSRFSSSFV